MMKTYSNLHVPWHTHLYRAWVALFVKSDRPWHVHCYRSFESAKGNPKYTGTSSVIKAQGLFYGLLSPRTHGHAAATHRAATITAQSSEVFQAARREAGV